MKTNILKYSLLTAITLILVTSCVSEDDYALPTYKKVVLSENFESSPHGSGSNEVPVNLEGWVNVNLGTGNRVWGVKQFSNNKFAEFSSFYSVAPELDESWLITPEIDLMDSSYGLSFTTQVRFHNYDNLTLLISTNYDGTPEGISTATWEPLEAYIPGAAESGNDIFVGSGVVNLDAYTNSTIRIAFKYVGSKGASQTSTYQIDNIAIFEN